MSHTPSAVVSRSLPLQFSGEDRDKNDVNLHNIWHETVRNYSDEKLELVIVPDSRDEARTFLLVDQSYSGAYVDQGDYAVVHDVAPSGFDSPTDDDLQRTLKAVRGFGFEPIGDGFKMIVTVH